MSGANQNPASAWEAIVDATDIGPTLATRHGAPRALRGIFCTVSGTAVLEDQYGNQETFELTAGAVYPLRPKQKVSGTSTIIALYGD